MEEGGERGGNRRREREAAGGDMGGEGVCRTVCKYLVFLIPYILQCLLVALVTPKILIGIILVQAIIFVIFLVEKLAEVREHVCSLVSFIIQEIVLHAALLVYAFVFSNKFGGIVALKVLGYVSFSLVILSAVFRLIYVYKRKNNKGRQRRRGERYNRSPRRSNERDPESVLGSGGVRIENSQPSTSIGGRQAHRSPQPRRQPPTNPDFASEGKAGPPTAAVPSAPRAPPQEDQAEEEEFPTVIREAPPPYSKIDQNPM